MKTISRSGEPVRVFVGDANAMACQLMVRALEQSREPIVVAGSSSDPVEILKGLRENPSDVAIIGADLRNGPMTGLGVVKEARAAFPHTRIIVLVDSPERALVVEGFRAGADGVFSRAETFEMLCKCIRAVGGGQVWANVNQQRFIIEALAAGGPQRIKGASGANLLTKREEELVQLVAEGLTNRDIARQLGLTEHTVRNYLFRIFNKLGTSNRLELALYVIKQTGAHPG
jgi:two-component system, NarL family, nitrate/nitrite response regulator NarL